MKIWKIKHRISVISGGHLLTDQAETEISIENFSGVIIDAEDNKFYVKNGLLHREDGKAVISDSMIAGYYLNDTHISEKKFWYKQKNTQYADAIFAEYFGQKDGEI